ncbi:MAG: phosphorylase family protein [Planctomycetaceae bacterium]
MAQADSNANDTTHADVGIVYATPMEINPFLDRCEKIRKYVGGKFTFRGARLREARIALVQSGVGYAAATQATQALLDGHTPQWIVSAGFSGALAPELKIGDIVVGNSLADEQGHALEIKMQMPADPAAGRHVGRLLTTDRIVRTVAEKMALAQLHQAIAVDMESLAVARVCRDVHVPCMAVRAISDDLSADLPPEILTMLGDTGTVRLGAAVGALWRRPGSIQDLWRLRETARRAAQRLAGFLDGVVEQLYAARH